MSFAESQDSAQSGWSSNRVAEMRSGNITTICNRSRPLAVWLRQFQHIGRNIFGCDNDCGAHEFSRCDYNWTAQCYLPQRWAVLSSRHGHGRAN